MDTNAMLLLLKSVRDKRPSDKTQELEMLLQESLEREYLTSSWQRSAAQAAIKAKRLEQKLLEVLADKQLLNSSLCRMLDFLNKDPFTTMLADPDADH